MVEENVSDDTDRDKWVHVIYYIYLRHASLCEAV